MTPPKLDEATVLARRRAFNEPPRGTLAHRHWEAECAAEDAKLAKQQAGEQRQAQKQAQQWRDWVDARISEHIALRFAEWFNGSEGKPGIYSKAIRADFQGKGPPA
jgi:hypothetical protein